ncbi:pantoate--beta-alanine ligase [Naumannella halotolerans]|uniref:Pantothenate synthetase n=1 Tax=Naumannella halotolerans TaxID=993414 RepID=A0A4R7J290_9ACTN|nr:pantoate--beta-alanine ligase [Naumannella halotolerans]TDT31194.1 pantoate--beta-alanine ligase [Naumannella halotolerans]
MEQTNRPTVIRTVDALREALAPTRRAGQRIGLVPTMGALHQGHRSLMDRARAECDLVVVSIFVNPRQFDRASDLQAYPRTEEADLQLVADAGADLVFAPATDEVYPAGFGAEVRLRGPLVETLEGAHRGSGHFHGVTTVVSKLFNMCRPDVAYFGRKDAQQALVIAQLVRDLDFGIRIETCPTIRDPDGLALSSRNSRLSPSERQRALTLKQSLDIAAELVAGGTTDPETIIAAATTVLSGVSLEYFALVDPRTLEPVSSIDRPVLAAIAAEVGEVRLIDNLTLLP